MQTQDSIPNEALPEASPTYSIIDPHLHFFALKQGKYAWLAANNAPMWPDKHVIAKEWYESDLMLPRGFNLCGFVHIEAGFDNLQTWREIDWLAQYCHLPFRSIACATLDSREFPRQIEQLAERSSVVGIRHILDSQARSILTHPLSAGHFALLNSLQWIFEAQLSCHDIEAVQALRRLASGNSKVCVIINHAGWPPDVDDQPRWQAWKQQLAELAKLPNLAIKLSGWEMVNRQWTAEQLYKVTATCLEIFGERRVMLASNFPVCELSMPYALLWQRYHLTLAQRLACLPLMMYDNAKQWYRLAD
ncbi:MAG: amidohydrolase [Paraglaciecola sp.]|nr:amidohydrolase [Paraglaciecola sp.]NCT47421.1 amidohydrolase [Paraglaciecola sp.]